jgi:hypothetical protein
MGKKTIKMTYREVQTILQEGTKNKDILRRKMIEWKEKDTARK